MGSRPSDWSELADARLWPLWKRMPARRRAAAEVGHLAAAVLAPSGAALLAPLLGAVGAGALTTMLLGAWGWALLRAGAAWRDHGRLRRLAATALLALATSLLVAAPLWLSGTEAALAPSTATADRALLAVGLRNAAVLILLALLLRSDGQDLEQLGLSRTKVGTQALYGLPALAGAFAVHLLVSAVLAVVVGALRTGALEHEAEQRTGAIGELLSTSHVPAFLALMLFAAAFEEIAFRGFVLPRLRHATGSWTAALLLMSLLFGLGHLYEGPLAVLQTAALGILFGLVLMWRGHLLPAIVAHVGFNGVMIAVALWLRHTGAL